jgi:hypothetical protein
MNKIKIGFFFVFTAVSALALQDDVSSRYLLFMRTQGQVFNEGYPDTYSEQNMLEISTNFPPYSPTNKVNVGVGSMMSYFRYDIDTVEKSLRRFLELSEKLSIPIWLRLDGEHWLDGRPDLWNWWDPAKLGYNPENAKNVEWTWWSSEYAIKIAWRNWGRQVRTTPTINLMSKDYIKANEKALEQLIPIIAEWYKNLPEDKKDLFAGISGGGETAIGVNSYYYPNGNELVNKPESEDPPSRGLIIDDTLSRGMQQIGYAAVFSAGIRTNGDLTEDDVVEVVRRHLRNISKKMYELGIPKEKIFSHGFGNMTGEKLFDAAVNEYSNPGWSSYWHTDDVLKDKGVVRNISRPEVEQWAPVEWLLLYRTDETLRWENAIRNTLTAPGAKLMCILNWEGVTDPGSTVIKAVNGVLKEELNPRKLPQPHSGSYEKSLYEVMDN